MNGYLAMKRTLDVLVSLVLAPFVVPLCLILMVVVRLESPGSPLFVQQRVGRHRVSFGMVKLRTMRADTEHVASHLVSHDKITRVGQVLRRFKLDELPQLWNVLTGSMSLVGPRPCLPVQDLLIAERERHGVFAYRPGITGPAQIIGLDMSQPRRLAEVEAAYFTRATLWQDLELVLKTATGKGGGDAALKRS